MKYRLFLFALTLLPHFAQAENLRLHYDASWNGIKAGTAEVEVNETGTTYNDKVRADAVGIAKTFTNYWTDNSVSGTISDGKYIPAVYNSKWQPKKAPTQSVVITYDKDGNSTESANPPENRGKHPEVAPAEKKGLTDPISAAMNVRSRIRDMVKAGTNFPQNFSMRIFDSRRVTDLNFNVTGYVQVNTGSRTEKLLEIAFNRSPVTGYTKKELEMIKNINPLINIYVNDQFIPVYASGQTIIGEVNLKLIRD